MAAVDLRCPVGARKLLGRYRIEFPGIRVPVVPGNLMELYCRDCSRIAKNINSEILHLLHRFDLTGELVETAVVFRDGHQEIQS